MQCIYIRKYPNPMNATTTATKSTANLKLSLPSTTTGINELGLVSKTKLGEIKADISPSGLISDPIK